MTAKAYGLLLAVMLVVAGCGGDSGVTSASIEEAVRPELEQRIAEMTDGPATTVDSLDCVKKSDREGSCVAKYSNAAGGEATSRISVDIDPETGDFVWEQQPVTVSP